MISRQEALGPILSSVVNDEDLSILSRILEQMDDLDDVARMRSSCRLLRDGVDECMRMLRLRALTVEDTNTVVVGDQLPPPRLWTVYEQGWTPDPWALWVARGDVTPLRPRPHMTVPLSRCDLPAVRVGFSKGDNLLHVAAYCGAPTDAMVRLLLRLGVACNQKEEGPDGEGMTPLHVACRRGHLMIATTLLEGGAERDQPRHDGATALWMACQEGHLEAVRLLLEAGANKDMAANNHMTPLMIACEMGHLEIVRLLLAVGADMGDDGGATTLWVACLEGHLEIVRLLLEAGATLHHHDMDRTPLFGACQGGYVEIVRLLVEAGAHVDGAANHSDFHMTPLFVACDHGYLEVAQVLVDKGADVEVALMGELTPLHVACRHGHTDIAALLVDAGARVNRVHPRTMATPLFVACEEGHLEIVAMLLRAGADKNLVIKTGVSPHLMASRKGYTKIAALLSDGG